MSSHAQPRGIAIFSPNPVIYTILPRNAGGTPGQPYEASEPIVAHVTKAIDICRVLLCQPDVLPAFNEIAWRYLVQTDKCWCLDPNGATKEKITTTFISKILLAFPLVFIDYTLNNPDSKGFHTRRQWDGDFEPRQQSISINGKRAEHMLAAFETTTLDRSRYQNFLLMTVNVLLQEIGHVYITYLSRGQEEPPQKRIKGLPGPFATMFDEADRTLQEKLFKGRLHYFRDPDSETTDEQCVTPYLKTVFIGSPDAGAYYRLLGKPIEDIGSLGDLVGKPIEDIASLGDLLGKPIEDVASLGNLLRKPIDDIASIRECLTILCTITKSSSLDFTSYDREESPEKRKLTTLGEGHSPDTYTDPLEEKEAAWLLKEYLWPFLVSCWRRVGVFFACKQYARS